MSCLIMSQPTEPDCATGTVRADCPKAEAAASRQIARQVTFGKELFGISVVVM